MATSTTSSPPSSRPTARAVGLWPSGPLNIGEPDNYRVPDRAYLRTRDPATFTPTAAIVVEIVSPGDETRSKLGFYFAAGVEELLVVDPEARTVGVVGPGDGRVRPHRRAARCRRADRRRPSRGDRLAPLSSPASSAPRSPPSRCITRLVRSFLSHGAHLPRRNDMSIDDATTEALDFLGKLPRHHGEETIATAATAGDVGPRRGRRCDAARRGGRGRHVRHVRQDVPRAAGLRPTAGLPRRAGHDDGRQPGSRGGDHPSLPAGYTYLGQFIDHDLTLDLTPLGDGPGGVISNFRSPRLDLDSLYGLGPGGTPFLYRHDDPQQFLIGQTDANRANDLPRAASGTALIGDPRNDENLVVAQLHTALLKFHNKVLTDWVRPNLPPQFDDFDETRRIVTFHYQYLILNDFLERITMPGTVADVLANGRRFFTFDQAVGPQIPVEFSAAAYRFGHSLVRENYNFNRNFPGASLLQLFEFTAASGSITKLPDIWVIDWRRFLPVNGHENAPGAMTHTRRIDSTLVPTLHGLPNPGANPPSLASRNLLRGVQKELPTGQDVADRMGLPKLSPADLSAGAPARP